MSNESVSLYANFDSMGQTRLNLYGKALALSSDNDLAGFGHSRVTLSGSQTYYFTATTTIASGSVGAYGNVIARRRR